ncbi:mannose/fructose/N-acetylgalactosamine-specific phosphotransferase system component IIB [Elusimicrobium posterum]|uniref:PTS system mannose/fructose/N-acetylgalactosamine-transporter subunit IIB n=1 Tax=Elusimicrobium posterum TaxID=3116653 RepID=UPI003C731D21
MINFARVDDRLIHGQIVQGWLPKLNVEEIVLAVGKIDPLQSTLMRMSLPDEYGLQILSIPKASAYIAQSDKKIFLLMREVETAYELIELGAEIKELNIGGLHYRDGRDKILDDVYISPDEKILLKDIYSRGIVIDGRSVPNEIKKDLKGILCS